MKFSGVLCYVVLTMVAASWVDADSRRNADTRLQHSDKGSLRKRDTKVFVRGFPVEVPYDRLFQKSKVIYRRISNQKHSTPKTIPHPSRTPKYRAQKPNKKPDKKFRNSKPISKPTRSKPNYENYISPSFGHAKPRRPSNQPAFGFIVKKPYHVSVSNDLGSFAEPPIDHINKYKQVQTYGEPPMKYAEEVRPDYGEIFSTAESFQDVKQYFGNQDPYIKLEEQKLRPEADDETMAYTNKYSKYTKPDGQVYVTPQPMDQYDDLESTYKNKYSKKENKYILSQRKPQYFTDNSKTFNRHWKSKNTPNEEIIVGGQYAEPPAKYVPIFQPSSPMYDEMNDSFAPMQNSFIDPQIVSSANISPYVNYKNSNMAFSPQNLNDAFSIVDK